MSIQHRTAALTFLYILLLGTGLTSPLCWAQRGSSRNKDLARPTPSPQAASNESTKARDAVTAQITQSVLQGGFGSGDDYVPCKFTLAELRALTAPEIAQTLSAADAEILKQRVVAAAQAQTIDSTLSGKGLESFIIAMAGENFDGLTTSQALNRVISLLRENRQPIATATIQKQINAFVPSGEQGNFNGFVDRSLSERKEELYTERTAYDVLKSAVMADQTLTDTQRKTFSQAVNEAATISKQATTASDAAAIVESARQALAALQRPADIGCAMSILSWAETHQAYGRLVANEYIAIQVVVRNLNRDQQFVLHDVEFAVNADPTGRLGRYFSGRDKMVVRSLVVAQQNFSPRNLLVHTAQGIASVMSAAAPVFGGSLVDASGVYNAGFVSSLDKFWKDQSIDQLNLLNDTGFSSTASSQTVVPKSGTVMVVTFIPSKQFEQGWWTKKTCIDSTYLGSTSQDGRFRSSWNENTIQAPTPPQTTAPPVLPSPPMPSPSPQAEASKNDAHTNDQEHVNPFRSAITSAAYGIDVGRLLETCIADGSALHPKPFRRFKPKPDLTVVDERLNLPKNADLFLRVKPTPFRQWAGNSVAIFRELSNTVVSGTHILQDDQLKSSLSQLTCPNDDLGNLLVAPDKPTFSCTAKGQNLDKIAKLRLRNASDATDNVTADGSLSVTGDPSSGTVSFQPASLLALESPAYDVYSVTTNGVEQKTGHTIHFDLSPVVVSVSPSPLEFSQPAPQTLTLNGFHLKSVKGIILVSGAVKTSPIAPASPVSNTQLSFQLNAEVLRQLSKGQDPVTVKTIDTSDKQKEVPVKITRAAAAAPAAANVPAKNSKKPAEVPAQSKGAADAKKRSKGTSAKP
jgi:hypothetical protein